MNKKVLSLVVALAAICGTALAAFIPAAGAASCPTGSVYTESGTCTTTTTATTPSTTTTATATTPAATTTTSTATTPATVTTPATPDLSTLTMGQAYAYLSTLPGVSVTKTGVVWIKSVLSSLPAGLALAPNVSIVSNSNGVLVISDAGETITVSYGSQLTVAIDGVIVITKGKTAALSDFRSAHATSAPVLKQYVIMPASRTSTKFAYTLPNGVSFKKGLSWKQIASYVKVYAVTNLKAMRVAHRAARTTLVHAGIAANKKRTAFVIKFAKPQKSYQIVFNTKGLVYSKAAKGKTLTGRMAVTSQAHFSLIKDQASFTFTS